MHFHNFCHDFNRALPVDTFTWANVHLVSNFIQLLLVVCRPVRALGQELADQTTDVLVGVTLPKAVRGCRRKWLPPCSACSRSVLCG